MAMPDRVKPELAKKVISAATTLAAFDAALDDAHARSRKIEASGTTASPSEKNSAVWTITALQLQRKTAEEELLAAADAYGRHKPGERLVP